MANLIYSDKVNANLLKFQNHNTPDATWTMESLSNGAGRTSAQYDLGAAPHGWMIEMFIEVQLAAAGTQYAPLRLYAAGAVEGDSTAVAGDQGTSDAAVDEDALLHMMPLLPILNENATSGEKLIRVQTFEWHHRYISLAAWNATGAAINSTAANFLCGLNVRALEVQ